MQRKDQQDTRGQKHKLGASSRQQRPPQKQITAPPKPNSTGSISTALSTPVTPQNPTTPLTPYSLIKQSSAHLVESAESLMQVSDVIISQLQDLANTEELAPLIESLRVTEDNVPTTSIDPNDNAHNQTSMLNLLINYAESFTPEQKHELGKAFATVRNKLKQFGYSEIDYVGVSLPNNVDIHIIAKNKFCYEYKYVIKLANLNSERVPLEIKVCDLAELGKRPSQSKKKTDDNQEKEIKGDYVYRYYNHVSTKEERYWEKKRAALEGKDLKSILTAYGNLIAEPELTPIKVENSERVSRMIQGFSLQLPNIISSIKKMAEPQDVVDVEKVAKVVAVGDLFYFGDVEELHKQFPYKYNAQPVAVQPAIFGHAFRTPNPPHSNVQLPSSSTAMSMEIANPMPVTGVLPLSVLTPDAEYKNFVDDFMLNLFPSIQESTPQEEMKDAENTMSPKQM